MVSKKELEILLERCEGLKKPRLELEQYVTPSPIAAEILNLALLKGDISGKKIVDLGCGTGRFAIGASLLGAADVTGVDIDETSLAVAASNAGRVKADVRWLCLDVSDFKEYADTIFQNPPFGARKKGADTTFINTAMELGKVIYTMHKTTTRDFIKKYVERAGGKVTDLAELKFSLPFSYEFHKKRIKMIDVDVYRIER